jgi:hypothetical protein
MATIDEHGDMSAPLWKRLAWLLLIWSASVAALGAVSLLLKLWLKP